MRVCECVRKFRCIRKRECENVSESVGEEKAGEVEVNKSLSSHSSTYEAGPTQTARNGK